eukprot:CCRYP_004511-RA/>CCRYP_004511-RA protein AED:0.38 eAED:0.38 QI:996/0/0.5/1/0/0/2/0/62
MAHDINNRNTHAFIIFETEGRGHQKLEIFQNNMNDHHDTSDSSSPLTLSTEHHKRYTPQHHP